jgi:metal-responsive CopG/Arc/MetJ family transcriptional regulator
MPVKPRNTDTVTFSLPPETARELREAAKEEQRTVSELLREAIRLYMEEREWRRRERLERLRTRQSEQHEHEGRRTQ